MKNGLEHRVPLPAPAAAIVASQHGPDSAADAHVFPGGAPGTGLSNMAMSAVLRRMNRQDVTVHGFRSSFRDWAAEATDHPGEVAELALAHANKNKVEAAYLRTRLFERRAQLMKDWADFLS